ncbi:hypothetical protein OEOE_1001 [Oenococcus oeni PSU-1]|uniref:Uncharacterized protein n=1 Tax=Oenococcus oeni (strain ATCC BAA-331 / PSU-1) TaxID=203123 RepID=Q04F62_OENOB|nr:hypothetical protein OEOE_1001 [Oenococcus oeni PSU-1]
MIREKNVKIKSVLSNDKQKQEH